MYPGQAPLAPRYTVIVGKRVVHTHLHGSQILFDKTGKVVLEETVRKNPCSHPTPFPHPASPGALTRVCPPVTLGRDSSRSLASVSTSPAPGPRRPDSHRAGRREAARAPTPPSRAGRQLEPGCPRTSPRCLIGAAWLRVEVFPPGPLPHNPLNHTRAEQTPSLAAQIRTQSHTRPDAAWTPWGPKGPELRLGQAGSRHDLGSSCAALSKRLPSLVPAGSFAPRRQEAS